MKRYLAPFFFLILFETVIGLHAYAQYAQGEDNIVLTSSVNLNPLPMNSPNQTAKTIENSETPAWLDAKMARLQAKAFSTEPKGVLTEENMVTTINTQGLRKTCTQSLAIPESAARNGFNNEPMALVLRGDLINICR